MKLTGEVKSVEFIEHIQDELDLCKIVIDFDELKIFGSYNDLVTYIGEYVEYMTRPDVIAGRPEIVVACLAKVYTVQTLSADENIKLIPSETTERQVCNFSINALRYGEYDVNCIAFLSAYEMGSSAKTKWIDCTMIDKDSKQFNLRIFTRSLTEAIDPEETIKSYVGHYVKFDINYTKFGYQTDEIELLSTPVLLPPEVDIAITQINSAVANDPELQEYMQRYNYIQQLSNIIKGELGYHLVDIAAEISFIKQVGNISNEYDLKTMIRAAICSRGYLLPSKTKFSRPMLNTNKVLNSALGKDRELILILDLFSEEEPSPSKKCYIYLSNFVGKIMNERRGIVDEEEVNSLSNINTYRNQFGGLL